MGLESLHVRMPRHVANAQAVAEFLEAHPKVEKVIFPGLASSPYHELYNEWNALFTRYENDPQSKIIDHIDRENEDYAIIETTLFTVLSKGAIMDLQFLRAAEIGGKWQNKCLV